MKSIIREMKVDMIDEIRKEVKEGIMKETKEVNEMTEMKEIMKIKICLNKIVREEHLLKNLNSIQKMIQKELKQNIQEINFTINFTI